MKAKAERRAEFFNGATIKKGIFKYKYIKRGLDVLFSLLGLLLLLPLFAIVALAIKLDSKGPVIFKQERLIFG